MRTQRHGIGDLGDDRCAGPDSSMTRTGAVGIETLRPDASGLERRGGCLSRRQATHYHSVFNFRPFEVVEEEEGNMAKTELVKLAPELSLIHI